MSSTLLIRPLILLALSIVVGHCYEITGALPDKSVVYKKIGESELELQIYLPPGYSKTDKRPAIVFFFGGGWKNGSPEQFYPHCEYFASRGMVAISADYRVETTHASSPRDCVKDGKSAVRWLRQHAGELGIDPNKLAAGGGSAGGQVAAAAATLKSFNEDGEDTGTSCRPDALVLFNPVIDNGPGGYGYDRVKDYWQDFSPMNNLGTNTPPTVVFFGTKDMFVPVATAEEFQKRMKANGVRCDLHLYADQPHGFFNYAKSKEYFSETVIEADKFLASLGFLKGEPTLQGGSKSIGK